MLYIGKYEATKVRKSYVFTASVEASRYNFFFYRLIVILCSRAGWKLRECGENGRFSFEE